MVLRRSAWSRSSRFGRAALFCVAWICADARVIQVIPGEVLHSLNPRPSPLHSRGVQAASVLPVIGLAPRGEDGMVASVEETESSASSTSSGRHSAGLPIVGPPRGLLATGLAGGKSFSGFLLCCHFYFIFSLLAYCRFFWPPLLIFRRFPWPGSSCCITVVVFAGVACVDVVVNVS